MSEVKKPEPVTYIDKLTPEQEAMIPVWRERWTEIGLSCEPSQWERAETALGQCYEFAGLEKPKQYIRVSSPAVACLAGAAGSYLLEEGKGFSQRAIKSLLPSPLREEVLQAVMQLPLKGKAATKEEIRTAFRERWNSYFGGQFWAWWPARESFFREACGLVLPDDLTQRARAYSDLVQSCGWVWPHEQFAIISDRPKWIDLDQEGRLHSTERAAIEWRDGWGLYAVQGVQVNPDWVNKKDELDPRRALTEENAELRRALTLLIGYGRVLEAAKVVEIGKDQFGRLLESVDFGDDDGKPARFIRVTCPSSNREYTLRVPPDAQSPRHALAWMHHPDRPASAADVNPLWYQPGLET